MPFYCHLSNQSKLLLASFQVQTITFPVFILTDSLFSAHPLPPFSLCDVQIWLDGVHGSDAERRLSRERGAAQENLRHGMHGVIVFTLFLFVEEICVLVIMTAFAPALKFANPAFIDPICLLHFHFLTSQESMFSLSLHELTACVYYKLAIERGLRGSHPDSEKLAHAPRRRKNKNNQNNYMSNNVSGAGSPRIAVHAGNFLCIVTNWIVMFWSPKLVFSCCIKGLFSTTHITCTNRYINGLPLFTTLIQERNRSTAVVLPPASSRARRQFLKPLLYSHLLLPQVLVLVLVPHLPLQRVRKMITNAKMRTIWTYSSPSGA